MADEKRGDKMLPKAPKANYQMWIILGLVVCVVVGIVSGLYPALKASRLDPIESLRYE